MNPDLNQLTNVTATQRANTQNLLGLQQGQNTDFLNRYKGLLGSQETTAQTANRLGQENNLPQLKQNANTLNTTMSNIPYTYRDATKGFDVNQNQLDRIIGQKSSELAPTLTSANNALNTAQNTVNTQLGYTQEDKNRALIPYQSEQQMMADQQARQTSLYSQDNQNELNALITKINTGVQLSEAEKNRAQQLAIAEKGYQNALDVARQQTKYLPVMNMGAINTETGGFITPTSGGWNI